jgi:hypothetical protein
MTRGFAPAVAEPVVTDLDLAELATPEPFRPSRGCSQGCTVRCF